MLLAGTPMLSTEEGQVCRPAGRIMPTSPSAAFSTEQTAQLQTRVIEAPRQNSAAAPRLPQSLRPTNEEHRESSFASACLIRRYLPGLKCRNFEFEKINL